MIHKIRLRGHVIHIYGTNDLTPYEPKTCIECKSRFDNGPRRKCYYLCCEFQECLNCVCYVTKTPCPVFKELEKKAKEEMSKKKKNETTKSTDDSIEEPNEIEGNPPEVKEGKPE